MSLLTNLLGYYKLDGDATDSTGTQDGVITGSPTFISAVLGQGIQNGGSNTKYISFSPALALGTSFSMSAWIRRTTASLAGRTPFVFINSDLCGWYIASDNVIEFFDHFGTDRKSTFTTVLNTWHHVVATYDGSTLRWYVDGAAAGTNSFTPFFGFPSSTMIVERIAGDNITFGGFEGDIDEVGFWTRVLDATEVGDLYNSGVGLSYPFSPAPTVSTVDPSSGPSAGGTPVTVTGTNFVDGATVTFGGVSAANVVWVSSTEITCETPAGTPSAAVTVRVTNPDTQYAELSSAFTYDAAPSVPAGEGRDPALDQHDHGLHFANAFQGRASSVQSVNGQVQHVNSVESIIFSPIDIPRDDGRYSGAIKFRFRSYKKRRSNSFS